MIVLNVLLIHNHFNWKHPILSAFSWSIRVVTRRRWNHNAIEVVTEKGRGILESVGAGVILTPIDTWKSKGGRIVLQMMPDDRYPLFTDNVIKMLHKPYGKLDILRILYHIVLNKVGIKHKWKGVVYSKRGYICSEVVSELLGLDPNILMLPGDFEYCDKLIKGKEYAT